MKKIFCALASCALLGLSFAACDEVSEDDRFIPAEIVPRRAVLIQDYTGQRCTNCPDGHKAIQEITATLGDSVVAVAIHGGQLSIPAPIGMATPVSDDYYKAAGQPPQPAGVINMQTDPLQYTAWGEAINKIIINPTPFTVKASTKVNGDSFDISVAFSGGEDYKGKLMVWVCENDIVALQIDHGTAIPDYVHNHVFRACATEDMWGVDVDLKANDPQYMNFSCPIESYWNKDNIYAVAFLYNEAGVAQVTQTASSH